MKRYCKECGKKEIGYLSLLDENGLCPFCRMYKNANYQIAIEKLTEENTDLKLKLYKIEKLIEELKSII